MIPYDLDLRSALVRNPDGGPNHALPLGQKRGGVVVHYSGGNPIPDDGPANLALLGSYAQYHALTADWSNEPGVQHGNGIMYHVAILRDGRVCWCRDLEDSLWHCATVRNRTAFSVLVMIGGNQHAAPVQLTMVRQVCDQLLAINGLARSEVRGHQEESPTACPGTLMQDFVLPYRATAPSAPNLDAALESYWFTNKPRLGEKRQPGAGTLARDWGGAKVLLTDRGILAADEDGRVREITARGLDDLVTYWKADGSLHLFGED